MPRIRSIKPETFLSESLADLPLSAMVSFIGIWTQADDQGRLKDSSRILNALLWGTRPDHTVSDMENDIEALSSRENSPLCRYDYDGKNYLHVTNWKKHQKINRPTPSSLPPCPYCEGTSDAPGKAEARHLKGGLFNFLDDDAPSSVGFPDTSYDDIQMLKEDLQNLKMKRMSTKHVRENSSQNKEGNYSCNTGSVSPHVRLTEHSFTIFSIPVKLSRSTITDLTRMLLTSDVNSTSNGKGAPHLTCGFVFQKEICNTNSLRTHTQLIEDSRTERKGKEGKGKEIPTPVGRRHVRVHAHARAKKSADASPAIAGAISKNANADILSEYKNISYLDDGKIDYHLEGKRGEDTMNQLESQDSLFEIPENSQTSNLEAEDKDNTSKPKKRRNAKATTERTEKAKKILDPWWKEFGQGWTQSYIVVRGVIISVLANGVPEDDISRAMDKLGRERKPISGGTIGFALSKMATRQNAANITSRENYRDPSTYMSSGL